MTEFEPDYSEYTLDELREARGTIDTERYPERRKLLDTLIRDREAVAARQNTVQRVTMADEDGDIASVKPGRGVSFGRGISEIVFSVLFAGLWLQMVPEDAGIFGVLIGWSVGIFGVIGGIYHLYNAFADRRFSEQDIVEPGKEPDPFAVLIGKEDDEERNA